MNNKVVLAFSGGLDTSFCIPYLKNEKGLEVHTVTVNTGGFQRTMSRPSKKGAGSWSRLTCNCGCLAYLL